MGGSVVFLSFPGVGHVGPVLPVARALAGRGHRVAVVVGDRLAARVADRVADRPVAVLPYPTSFPNAPAPPRTPREVGALVAAFQREALAALPAVWDRLTGEPVDVVVQDALSTAVGGLLADRAGCPTVRVFPGLAGNDEVPVNGAEPEPGDPGLDPADPQLPAAADEARAALARHGLAPADVARVEARPPAANLVFVPRSFQPRGDRFDGSYAFVGPEPPPDPPRTWDRPPGRRVALVSLGTTSPPNPGFFRSCARAFADTGWHLVMTTGGHLPAGADLGPGVEVHDWLDHHLVLPHADVVVTAAGAGSLMQAFGHGVPVVAVPQKADARPVARHVEHLGLGRALTGELTGELVHATAVAVADDPAARAAARRMATDIAACGGAERAADVVERVAAGR
jgi:MGT family glycosyltransferase